MVKQKHQHKPFVFIEILAIALAIFIIIAGIRLFRHHMAYPITQTYTGTFPCADCSGLDTTLTLSKDTSNATYGTYTLEEIYEGKDLKPYTVSGIWNIIHGTATDPKAPVLELQTDKTLETSYFQINTPTTLEMIDHEKKLIASPFNLKLTLQN